jgi:zinc transport system substrate-binding protein
MIFIVLIFKPDRIIKDENKIQIVATLFPQYDFAKQIVGDKAEVTLLVGSGVETHNFEPTAQDMVMMLDKTDMFLYTGTFLEPWTEDIIETLSNSKCKIVDVSENIELIKIEDFESRHINDEIKQEKHIHEEENHEHNESCNHQDMYDGHIWQSLDNAQIMLDNILNVICKIDPENADYYKENANRYKEEIKKLDTEIEQIVENSNEKEIAVGGEFAYAYFVEQYDLKFVSVYTNCGHGEDPSIAKVKSVIDYINNHEMPAVYYEELSEGTVAKMIAEETEAEALVLYSIHNGNPEEDTYVSLMRRNIESLKKGLK